jgi:hypothetical protein
MPQQGELDGWRFVLDESRERVIFDNLCVVREHDSIDHPLEYRRVAIPLDVVVAAGNGWDLTDDRKDGKVPDVNDADRTESAPQGR